MSLGGGRRTEFDWPDDSAYERAYLEPLLATAPNQFVANVATTLSVVRVGGHVLPVTVNDAQYDNSYVCSPYTAVVSYPLEELAKIDSRPARLALAALIRGVAPLLRLARINRVVAVNNWMLSTNLYPAWDGDGIVELTTALRRRFPNRAILFRSLTHATNGPLCRRLADAGYRLAPSRQVYLFDGAEPDYLRRPNTRWDQKLLDRPDYTLVPHDALTADDDRAVVRLYEMLYLKKYSYHNPQFTERLVRLWREKRLLEMTGLRNAHGGLDGIVGCFARNRVMTAPLVGYDVTRPQALGLYRRLMAVVLRSAARRGWLLNLSSGAAEFKRLRGGVPEIEYSAVYCDHLPPYPRAVWRGLIALLVHVGERTLTRYRL